MPLSPEEIEAACHYWYVTPARAIDELGFRPRPVREAMEATVKYLRDRGLRPPAQCLAKSSECTAPA